MLPWPLAGSSVEALATCRTNRKDLLSRETRNGPNTDISAALGHLFPLTPQAGKPCEPLLSLRLHSSGAGELCPYVLRLPLHRQEKGLAKLSPRRIIPWILGCSWWASGQQLLFLSGFSTGSIRHKACSSTCAPSDCAEAWPCVAALQRALARSRPLGCSRATHLTSRSMEVQVS